MTKRLTLFTAWCLFLVALSGVAAFCGWSPFADNDTASSSSSGGVHGPTHK